MGCSSAEKASPAVAEEETTESPAEGAGTTPAEGSETMEPPTPTEEGSGTDGDQKSTATKTGEAVGGALKTAGKATEEGVKTGVNATVKGAKVVGNATKDVVEGAANTVKGDKEKP